MDILITSFLVYKLITWAKVTRTGQLVKGLLALVVAYFLADWMQLQTMKYAMQYLFSNGLILLAVTMVAFYSTTFDALTMVVSSYSYKRLKPEQEPDKRIRTFWAVVFILLPIALIFSENSMNSLQSVSIIAAFPIGIIILIIVASFFKDASSYLRERKDI